MTTRKSAYLQSLVLFWIVLFSFPASQAFASESFFYSLQLGSMRGVQEAFNRDKTLTGLERNEFGQTALFVLFIHDDFCTAPYILQERIQIGTFLLENQPQLAKALNLNGQNPLFAALRSYRHEPVALLIGAGTDPNQRETTIPYQTPREWAIQQYHLIKPATRALLAITQKDLDRYEKGPEIDELMQDFINVAGLNETPRLSELPELDSSFPADTEGAKLDLAAQAKAASDRAIAQSDRVDSFAYSLQGHANPLNTLENHQIAADRYSNMVLVHYAVAKGFPALAEVHRRHMRYSLRWYKHHLEIAQGKL